MKKYSVRKLVVDGLLIAVVFLGTYFTRFPGPVPPGYINLGDAVIIVAALVYGRRSAFLAGAIGSALADFVAGAIIFVPVTFVVKGVEGFIMGHLAHKLKDRKSGKIISIFVGMAIMVAGYFIAEATFLGLLDETLGLVAAKLELPFNLIQAGASAVVGYALVTLLPKNLNTNN